MTFIQTIPPEEATGDLEELYERDLASLGYVANYTRAMTLRPEVIAAYRALHGAIRANLDPCRYELVTVAAAAQLRSSYCMLAHGAALRMRFFGPEQVEAIAHDYRNAELDATEVAIMGFAQKVTQHAYTVAPEDIAELRAHGLSDTEILDVILATVVRNFMSKALDALGAEPDPAYGQLEESLRRALTVGRQFGEKGEAGEEAKA